MYPRWTIQTSTIILILGIETLLAFTALTILDYASKLTIPKFDQNFFDAIQTGIMMIPFLLHLSSLWLHSGSAPFKSDRRESIFQRCRFSFASVGFQFCIVLIPLWPMALVSPLSPFGLSPA